MSNIEEIKTNHIQSGTALKRYVQAPVDPTSDRKLDEIEELLNALRKDEWKDLTNYSITLEGLSIAVSDQPLELSWPTLDLNFVNCHFKGHHSLKGWNLRKLSFSRCAFDKAVLISDGGKDETIIQSSLEMRDCNIEKLMFQGLMLANSSDKDPSLPDLLDVQLHRCIFKETLEVVCRTNPQAHSPLPGNFKRKRLCFGLNDCAVYGDVRQSIEPKSEGIQEFFSLAPRSFVQGSFICQKFGTKKGHVNLAVNAADLRVGGEFRISDAQLMEITAGQSSGRPRNVRALNLNNMRCKLLSFGSLGDVPFRSEVPNAKDHQPSYHHKVLSRTDSNDTPLARQNIGGLSSDRAQLLTGRYARTAQRKQFWLDFCHMSAGGSLTQTLLTMARAMAIAGDLIVADDLVRYERKVSIRRAMTETDDAGEAATEDTSGRPPDLNVEITWREFSLGSVIVLGVLASWSFFQTFLAPQYKLQFDFDLVLSSVAIAAGILFFITRAIGLNKEPDRKFVPHLWLYFRRLSYTLIRDGMRPGAPLPYLFGIWVFGTLLFSFAALMGMIAPDEPDVFRADHEMWLIEEVRGVTDSPHPVGAKAFFAQCLDGNQSEQDLSALLAKAPVATFQHACRINWARPGWIDEDDWRNTIKYMEQHGRLRQTDASAAESANTGGVASKVGEVNYSLMTQMDPGCVCQRMLPAEYSTFAPWIYAADVVIPLLELRQEDEWSIRIDTPPIFNAEGDIVEASAWSAFLARMLIAIEVLLVLSGWIFALILVGGISSLADANRRPY